MQKIAQSGHTGSRQHIFESIEAEPTFTKQIDCQKATGDQKQKGGWSIDQDATEVGLANPLALCNYLQRQTLELMSNKF